MNPKINDFSRTTASSNEEASSQKRTASSPSEPELKELAHQFDSLLKSKEEKEKQQKESNAEKSHADSKTSASTENKEAKEKQPSALTSYGKSSNDEALQEEGMKAKARQEALSEKDQNRQQESQQKNQEAGFAQAAQQAVLQALGSSQEKASLDMLSSEKMEKAFETIKACIDRLLVSDSRPGGAQELRLTLGNLELSPGLNLQGSELQVVLDNGKLAVTLAANSELAKQAFEKRAEELKKRLLRLSGDSKTKQSAFHEVEINIETQEDENSSEEDSLGAS